MSLHEKMIQPATSVRGPVFKLQPEGDGGQDPPCGGVLGALLVARGHPAKLFQPLDEPFQVVAQAGDSSVKRPRPPFVLFARDRRPHAPPPQVLPNRATAGAFVTDVAVWAAVWVEGRAMPLEQAITYALDPTATFP